MNFRFGISIEKYTNETNAKINFFFNLNPIITHIFFNYQFIMFFFIINYVNLDLLMENDDEGERW